MDDLNVLLNSPNIGGRIRNLFLNNLYYADVYIYIFFFEQLAKRYNVQTYTHFANTVIRL